MSASGVCQIENNAIGRKCTPGEYTSLRLFHMIFSRCF